jgi:predicted ATP-grasp superfamily ATP-dependent carboligase
LQGNKPLAKYLIVAQSGRALAASADRSNCPVHVIDCFADLDTCEKAQSVKQIQFTDKSFARDILLEAIKNICLEHPGIELIPGSGFEQQPALLQTLFDIAPCLGNSAEVIRKVKDPICFFGLLDELGISHPETTTVLQDAGNGWLCKKIGGMGGDHIVRDHKRSIPAVRDVYFQQFLEGQSFSALFLANGKQAQVLGFSEIWHADDLIDTPFIYGGAASLTTLPETVSKWITAILNKLVIATGMKGLCGLDFILDRENQVYVLEVNPRPPATFELHERGRNLFSDHIQACHGCLPEQVTECEEHVHGHTILYARQTLIIPAQMEWPSWTADRPRPGRKILLADPVCTINATGRDRIKLKKLLDDRRFFVDAELVRWQNAA